MKFDCELLAKIALGALILFASVFALNQLRRSMFKSTCPPGYEAKDEDGFTLVGDQDHHGARCMLKGQYSPAQSPKGAQCKNGETSVNYGGRLDCYGPGDYPNLVNVYPRKQDCHIEAGKNKIIAFNDPNMTTKGWAVRPGQTLDRTCSPAGFKVEKKVN